MIEAASGGDEFQDDIALSDVKPGDIILYRLRIIDLPVNPDRLWRGRIKAVFPATDWTTPFLIVLSLEPGYEGMTEIIHPPQIRVELH